MKFLFQIFIATFLLVGISTSCSDDDQTTNATDQQVSFGFDASLQSISGKENPTLTPVRIRLTVKDMDGEIMNEEGMILDLFEFGESHVSESVTLVSGSYQLTMFQVLNAENKVIYASPLEGSEKAPLVDHALPLVFGVTQSEKTTVLPEVLLVQETDSPADFGYVEFGFEVVETFDFPFAVISDQDGSLVESTVYVVERDADYLQLSVREIAYSGDGLETLTLRKDVAVTEIQIVSPGYHSNSFVSNTSLMEEPPIANENNQLFKPTSEEGHLFFLSRKDEMIKYFIPLYPFTYQSYVFLYISSDPCNHFMRVDFAGWRLDEDIEWTFIHNFNEDPFGVEGWTYGISGTPAPWGWRADVEDEIIPFVEPSPYGNYLMTGFAQTNQFNICNEYPESNFRIENEFRLSNFYDGESKVDLMLELQWNSNEGSYFPYCNACGTIFYQWDYSAGDTSEGEYSENIDTNFRQH